MRGFPPERTRCTATFAGGISTALADLGPGKQWKVEPDAASRSIFWAAITKPYRSLGGHGNDESGVPPYWRYMRAIAPW
jgi:hypothetical protein